MKLTPPRKLKELAALIGADFKGDPDHPVSGLNEIHRVETGDLVFVDHPKYYDKALQSQATTILINKKVECPDGKALILSDDPFRDYNRLVLHFYNPVFSRKQISDSAVIGKNSVIMHGVFIGNNVSIGDDCVIHPNVTLYDHCVIGNRVIIHANSVIGSDAFYYKRRTNQFEKLVSCGRVVIGDDVEIGALCSVDRGVSADTMIGKGTKIDNQVQVGHDTLIGERCLIAAQTGIAGAVVIKDEVTLWGQTGIPSGITVGKGAVVMAQSGLMTSAEPGKSYFGSPAGETRDKMKEIALIRKLPEIVKKLGL